MIFNLKSLVENLKASLSLSKNVNGDTTSTKTVNKRNIQSSAPAIIAGGSIQAGGNISVGNRTTIHNHGTERSTEAQPPTGPRIYIGGARIYRPDSLFTVDACNSDREEWYLESVQVGSVVCKVGRGLPPNQLTRNLLLQDAPIPPFDTNIGSLMLIVSRSDTERYRIEQRLELVPMAIGKFDIGSNSFEQRPYRVQRLMSPIKGQ